MVLQFCVPIQFCVTLSHVRAGPYKPLLPLHSPLGQTFPVRALGLGRRFELSIPAAGGSLMFPERFTIWEWREKRNLTQNNDSKKPPNASMIRKSSTLTLFAACRSWPLCPCCCPPQSPSHGLTGHRAGMLCLTQLHLLCCAGNTVS